ncbi:hypothetical protein FGG08_003855 [Glutinoglossum americanum]|uniref:Serine protease n=1 Tax=Glutinoglossum americanum TaxID=1670608 RepID=A0A9P8HXH3_9PEZI|nr:hypothetical protein FGG08_003855 [Glutinoglossum americanum]
MTAKVARSTQLALNADAINTAAIVNQLTDTVVARWDLKSTDDEAPESLFLDYTNGRMEKVVGGGDERVKVKMADYKPGGKYRSIVKIFLQYEKQNPNGPWPMATGWLVKDDLMVTAGHCVYDWSHTMGRLTRLKAYIGYHGKASIGDPSVEFRMGKRVVAPAEWLAVRGNKTYDVAFIQLQKPFTGIKPIKFVDTPGSGESVLGVVGYPGDLRDDVTGELGAEMYQMFLKTTFDLEESKERMLEYQIDTNGGNSGSPVFRQQDMASIGVHVYGGDVNSASVIGFKGVIFEDCLSAFNAKPISAPIKKQIPGVDFVRIPPTESRKPFPAGTAGGWGENGETANGHRGQISRNNHMEDEGFFDDFIPTLKSAVKIGAPIASNVLQAGLPILFGPIGAPIAALASVALRAAGKAAESSSASESFSLNARQDDGLVERAILAEAALAGVMALNKKTLAEENLFSKMKDVAKVLSPVVKEAAPKVMGVITEPALRVALDTLNDQNKGGAATESAFAPGSRPTGRALRSAGQDFHAALTGASLKGVDHNTRAFVDALLETPPEESIWGDIAATLGSVAINALVPAGQVNSMLNDGLTALARSGSEANFGEDDSTISLDGLHQRAMLGEAALQAVMQVPVERLQEEGFFDVVRTAIKVIAPKVIKAAPGIIKAVAPVVQAALGTGAESTLRVVAPQKPGLRRIPSNMGMGIQGGDFLGMAKDWEGQVFYLMTSRALDPWPAMSAQNSASITAECVIG